MLIYVTKYSPQETALYKSPISLIIFVSLVTKSKTTMSMYPLSM